MALRLLLARRRARAGAASILAAGRSAVACPSPRVATRCRFLVLRAFAALLLSGGSLALFPPTALGHAAFLESTPAAGARLDRSPARIALEFTEPLNQRLTKATLSRVTSGEPAPIELRTPGRRELVLSPAAPLERGAYRLKWHTVSTEDGHALEGSFSFGVGVAASSAQAIEQSPLARHGWIRIALRALFYASLFFFAGGLFTAVLLGPSREPGAWLAPPALQEAPQAGGNHSAERAERARARTVDAGWLATALAVAVALAEAADAGGVNVEAVTQFLLSHVAGLGRVGTVLALAAATLVASRLPRVAACFTALALLAIALSGHANSAEPRMLAVTTDWLHLLAGAVWLGGIAQIAVAWLPLARGLGRELRLALMRTVLEPFGKVALPAFLLVTSTGLSNAWIQLGRPAALWETPYGRLLALKIGVVGAIALASYWHALRLRPRLLAANPPAPPERLERRHWRLLGSEPLLSVAVVAVAATLVAFPLPPRQLGEAGEAEALAGEACDPCPQPKPRADELAVAEGVGSSIAAVWLRRDASGLSGRLRLLDSDAQPVRGAKALVVGAQQRRCGAGCVAFRLAGRPATLEVRASEKGRTHIARIPARWRPGEDRRAHALLGRAQGTMRNLRSVQEEEVVTSGPGSLAETHYRLRAPNRLAYRTKRGVETVVIGRRQWSRTAAFPWRETESGGGLPFRTRSWFRWTSYARAVRLLELRRDRRRRFAEVALMDPGTPVWFRLRIDLGTMRVIRVRMVTGGHFTTQRFAHFNRDIAIAAPRQTSGS